ncbi:MAG: sigma-70 family RNA polymerase sigma factor [Alphaproteobacteria bacterium]|nr:sigma-70 family RNA polymerase sigma factor [Alphaproteobacteria bacterium]
MSLSIPPESPLDAAVPTVARWCARLGGPWVDPEDAAQDVLATATRRLPSLRDPALLEPWLFGITRRVLAAHRRRAWWRRWVSSEPPERADLRPGPEQTAQALHRARRLQGWLEQLPAAQREVVVLCALEERSSAEAADLLGVPQGTVKSRLRLAMARLRALAEEEDG